MVFGMFNSIGQRRSIKEKIKKSHVSWKYSEWIGWRQWWWWEWCMMYGEYIRNAKMWVHPCITYTCRRKKCSDITFDDTIL